MVTIHGAPFSRSGGANRTPLELTDAPMLTAADVSRFVLALSDLPDPLERFRQATSAQAVHRGATDDLGHVRDQAIAELHDAGRSYAEIAQLTGLTRARVQQLVERGRYPGYRRVPGRCYRLVADSQPDEYVNCPEAVVTTGTWIGGFGTRKHRVHEFQACAIHEPEIEGAASR